MIPIFKFAPRYLRMMFWTLNRTKHVLQGYKRIWVHDEADRIVRREKLWNKIVVTTMPVLGLKDDDKDDDGNEDS